MSEGRISRRFRKRVPRAHRQPGKLQSRRVDLLPELVTIGGETGRTTLARIHSHHQLVAGEHQIGVHIAECRQRQRNSRMPRAIRVDRAAILMRIAFLRPMVLRLDLPLELRARPRFAGPAE